MNVNDFADFCLQFFTFVYFDFTFSMLLYKIYCAKYIKLSVENTGTTSSTATLSTILGYENGGDLIVPSGVTLVTEKKSPLSSYKTIL